MRGRRYEYQRDSSTDGGAGEGAGISWVSGWIPESWETADKQENDTTDWQQANVLDSNNAAQFGKTLRNMFCFCKSAVIYLLSCDVGLSSFSQQLADGANVTVIAPVGLCKTPDKVFHSPENGVNVRPDPEEAGSSGSLKTFNPTPRHVRGRRLMPLREK
jgi:hypothetical protein